MDFCELLKPLKELDEDDWEVVSRYSANTGYTGGTPGTVNLTRHSRVRMLERGIDDYLVRHVLARGQKSFDEDDGVWRFEKDGVVVIASSDLPGDAQVVITSWRDEELPVGDVTGFVTEKGMKAADARYRMLVEALESALDSDDRLAVLQATLGADLEHVLGAVDLERTPPDRPLLMHCAEQGYAECVRALLHGPGNFNAGILCAKDCTLLHMVAWGGHPAVWNVIGSELCVLLADIANDYHELPEQTAWARFCETGERRFLEVAVAARNCRLEVSDTTEQIFVEEADRLLRQTDPWESICTLPPGASFAALEAFFRNEQNEFRHISLDIFNQKFVGVAACWTAMLTKLRGKRSLQNLQRLKLEGCGLTPDHMVSLSEYLQQKSASSVLAFLSISKNEGVGDVGFEVLARAAELFSIETLKIAEVGLTLRGLRVAAEALCRHWQTATSATRGRPQRGAMGLRKFVLSGNDLSATLGTAPGVSDDPEKGVFLALFRGLASTLLTHLDLSGTRLSPSQVAELCEAVPGVPTLETLDLMDISLSEQVESCIVGMLRDMSANVRAEFSLKRLVFNRLTYPRLWGAVGTEIKRRLFAQAYRRNPEAWGSAVGETAVLVGFGRGENVARVGRELRACGEDVHYPLVHTPHGTVRLRDPNDELARFRPGDVVEYLVSYSSPHHCLQVAATRPAMDASIIGASLLGCNVVFFRPSTRCVLMLTGRTNEYRTLCRRLGYGILPDMYDLAERFPGSHVKDTRRRRLSLTELLEDLDPHRFADAEVEVLAALDTPEALTALKGTHVHITDCVRASVARLRACSQLRGLQEVFAKELAARMAGRSTPVPPNLFFPGNAGFCAARMGERGNSWLFPELLSTTVDYVLEQHFLPTLGVSMFRQRPGTAGYSQTPVGASKDMWHKHVKSVDCVDSDAMWFHRMFVVGVSESMVDNDLPLGLMSNLQRHLSPGLISMPHLQRQPPRWVPTDDADALATALHHYREDGFKSMPSRLQNLLASFESDEYTLHVCERRKE